GPPPTVEHEAAHSCGKGHEGCVNPHHLRWATSTENKADTLIHGTRNRGERNRSAKLTDAKVYEIRRLLAAGMTQTAIAAMFAVSLTTISKIAAGKIWGWLA